MRSIATWSSVENIYAILTTVERKRNNRRNCLTLVIDEDKYAIKREWAKTQ